MDAWKLHARGAGNLLVALIGMGCLNHWLALGLLQLRLHGYWGASPLAATGVLRLLELGLFAILYRGDFLSILGISAPRAALAQLALGMGMALGGAGLFFLADAALTRFTGASLLTLLFGPPRPEAWRLDAAAARFLLVGCLIGPFAEEFFFRGVLVRAVGPGRHDLLTKIFYDPLLMLAFVLPHFTAAPTLGVFLKIAAVKGACAFFTLRLYDLTGCLLAGFVLHGCGNAVIYFALGGG